MRRKRDVAPRHQFSRRAAEHQLYASIAANRADAHLVHAKRCFAVAALAFMRQAADAQDALHRALAAVDSARIAIRSLSEAPGEV